MSSERMFAKITIVVLVSIMNPLECGACFVFALQTDSGPVFGQNLNWYESFSGHVIVNVRAVEKSVIDRKGDWPVVSTKPTISWRSRYGSVTFTSYGRDLIEGGNNEAGLIVDETNRTADYPPEDRRPGISFTQWMPYQLDNFATIDEVLAHLDTLRPDGEGWHYLIADASGECAVIAYFKGTTLVHTADDVEICAHTNTTYRPALSHILMDLAFGGEIDIAAGDDTYGRFVCMATAMEEYEPKRHGIPRDYSFATLDDVGSEDTRRSIVYDAPARRVLWRTQANRSIRWLGLSALDPSPSAPTRLIDADACGPGDVSPKFTKYSIEKNRQIVRGVRDSGERSEAAARLLADRGLTYDKALEMIVRHPTVVQRRESGFGK